MIDFNETTLKTPEISNTVTLTLGEYTRLVSLETRVNVLAETVLLSKYTTCSDVLRILGIEEIKEEQTDGDTL